GASRGVLEPLAKVAIEVHDAFFRLRARLRSRFGDIDRSPQKHLALARMPGCLPAFAVGFDVRGELRQGAQANRDKHAVAQLADRREGVGAVGGNADFGPGLLIGLGGRPDVFERVVFARIGKWILGPRLFQDLERLGKALAAFAIGHAISLVGAREAAAPDAEDQPSVADLVYRGRFFRQAQRMAERQYLDAGADL